MVSLSEAESHHLAKVLRKKVGENVELFDGSGLRAPGRIELIAKREVKIRLLREPFSTLPGLPHVTLAVAPPKGDRFRWLVEKATEIGVARIIPIQTERTVVNPGENKLDKLRQTMIAACKQSGRDQFLDLQTHRSIASLRDILPQFETALYGDVPRNSDVTPLLKRGYKTGPVLGIIGPEGGFSLEETELFRSWGALPISLSPHILRIETAAIAFASLFIGGQMGISQSI